VPKPRQRTGKQKSSRWARGKYTPRRKVCFFCTNKNETVEYKDPNRLRNYVSDRGKIEPRRRTGICARHQRSLATAIKRARHLALLPYVPAHIRKMRTFSADAA